jgi:hypothetical protein
MKILGPHLLFMNDDGSKASQMADTGGGGGHKESKGGGGMRWAKTES